MGPLPPAPAPFTKYDEAGAYHWTEVARSSRRYNPALDARYEVMVRALGRASRALDIGCGDGYLMSRLSPRCRIVVGVDSEWTGARLASERLPGYGNCRVIHASSYQIPFAAGSFDAVVMA